MAMTRRNKRAFLAALVILVVLSAGVWHYLVRSPGRRSRSPGECLVSFPVKQPCGWLHIRDWGSDGLWKPLAEACGTVEIPPGKELLLATRGYPLPPHYAPFWEKAIRRLGLKLKPPPGTDLSFLATLGAHDLQGITLYDMALTDPQIKGLRAQKSLRLLNLSKNQITDAGLLHLRPLRLLETLRLASNPIGDNGLAHLKRLRNLRGLWLQGTLVTDAGLEPLQKLDDLEVLWLPAATVTERGIAQLQKALPGCAIRR